MSGRVIVCGGRNFGDRRFVFQALDALRRSIGIETVIHGACGCDMVFDESRLRGVDGLAHAWSSERGVQVEAYPAPWRDYGRQAGPMRNDQMLRAAPDAVVAFPGGAGTSDMVARALEAGVVVYEVCRDRKIRRRVWTAGGG